MGPPSDFDEPDPDEVYENPHMPPTTVTPTHEVNTRSHGPGRARQPWRSLCRSRQYPRWPGSYRPGRAKQGSFARSLRGRIHGVPENKRDPHATARRPRAGRR